MLMQNYLKATKILKYVSWLFIFLLIIIQYREFSSYLDHVIIGFYPANFDQSDYLPLTYGIVENTKTLGFFSAYKHSMFANGVIFPLNALISYFFVGVSRFGALLPNFIYFSFLEIFMFWTVTSFTKKIYPGFILLGLTLTLKTPFITGGIGDFRMDFIAFCLYGIFACAVIKSEVFLNKKWTIAAALIATITILMRCITLAYFATALTALFICFLTSYFLAEDKEKKLIRRCQLGHLALFALMIVVFISPILITYRSRLYDYYIVGHLTGAESHFRGMLPGESLLDAITFYPRAIFNDHIELIGKYLLGFLLICFCGVSLVFRKGSISSPVCQTAISRWKDQKFFLWLSILLPLLVLTMDPARSVVVGGIVIIPFFLWVTLFCVNCEGRIFSNNYLKPLLYPLALIIFFWGSLMQGQLYAAQERGVEGKKEDLAVITKMHSDIGNYALKAHWSAVNMSIDQIVDYLSVGSLRTLYYETHGKLLVATVEPFGGTILAVSKQDAIKSLGHSNVIILTVGSSYPSNAPVPFNQSVAFYRQAILNYAEHHFKRLADYNFFGNTYRVYVKG